MIGDNMHSCPYCKAPQPKDTRPQHFYTCVSCSLLFIRYEKEPQKEQLATSREPFSPIVIGSRGRVKDESFEVTGCITLYQKSGVTYLFTILWSHGLSGYLLEQEGRYSICSAIELKPRSPIRGMSLDMELKTDKYGTLYCHSISKIKHIGLKGEGALCLPLLSGSLFCSFHQSAKKSVHAFFQRDQACLLYGDHYTLEELSLGQLRDTSQWLTKGSFEAPRIVNCAGCDGRLKIYTHTRALGFCCPGCGTSASFNEEHEALKGKKLQTAAKTTFKPGQVFVIEGEEFLLLNYVVKQEQSYHTNWTEYTLYNPKHHCWVLSESEGHYNLMKPSQFYLPERKKAQSLNTPESGRFQLYSKYRFRVKHAAGELLSNSLSEDSQVACADYVNAPHILSYESSHEDICWFMGEYCDHATVKSWVKDTVALPDKEGISPNQPFVMNFEHNSLVRITVILVISLFILQAFLSGVVNSSHQAFGQSYFINDSIGKVIKSDPFEISATGAIDVELRCEVYNSWLEGDFTLVNETTGDQYYFSSAIEYYAGYEGGENWHEGATEHTITIGNVTRGRYHLNGTLTHPSNVPNLSIIVIENVPLMRNFAIVLLVLLAFPAFIVLRKRRFDRKQWYNSHYSPYTYAD